jgi:hypothetical protein
MLLSAYRYKFDIDAVVQLWPQIYELGLRHANSGASVTEEGAEKDPTDPTHSRLKANILCVPLSIYIDALSAAGKHMEISRVWRRLQMAGFTFDSHNWNHLAVALVRAGQLERAFEVIERVILPYQRQSERMLATRDTNPTTPLTFDSIETSDELPLPPPQYPMHNNERRARMVASTSDQTLIGPAKVIDEVDVVSDFAAPLFILHKFSPSWNIWCPHTVTLGVLLMVHTRLRSGTILSPVMPTENREADEQADGIHNVELANELLERINTEYPRTVALVLKHEREERQRLKRGFDEAYSWS